LVRERDLHAVDVYQDIKNSAKIAYIFKPSNIDGVER